MRCWPGCQLKVACSKATGFGLDGKWKVRSCGVWKMRSLTSLLWKMWSPTLALLRRRTSSKLPQEVLESPGRHRFCGSVPLQLKIAEDVATGLGHLHQSGIYARPDTLKRFGLQPASLWPARPHSHQSIQHGTDCLQIDRLWWEQVSRSRHPNWLQTPKLKVGKLQAAAGNHNTVSTADWKQRFRHKIVRHSAFFIRTYDVRLLIFHKYDVRLRIFHSPHSATPHSFSIQPWLWPYICQFVCIYSLILKSSTLSFPRVINTKFSLQPHQK